MRYLQRQRIYDPFLLVTHLSVMESLRSLSSLSSGSKDATQTLLSTHTSLSASPTPHQAQH